MKKLVLIAGAVLALSFVFPDGVKLNVQPSVVETPVGETDAKIVLLLKNADAADKRRIYGVYSGLAHVLKRDAGKLMRTTEQWALVQANTLDNAIDTQAVGKYPGLDVAINDVFLRVMGTDEVTPNNPDTQAKLIRACTIIADSAR